MKKTSAGIYKMPYFNIEHVSLRSVNKIKYDTNEIICVCAGENGCTESVFKGYKYSLQYQAQPTVEPLSYKLKGYTWDATLNYNDIGSDAEDDMIEEIDNYFIESFSKEDLDVVITKTNL